MTLVGFVEPGWTVIEFELLGPSQQAHFVGGFGTPTEELSTGFGVRSELQTGLVGSILVGLFVKLFWMAQSQVLRPGKPAETKQMQSEGLILAGFGDLGECLSLGAGMY